MTDSEAELEKTRRQTIDYLVAMFRDVPDEQMWTRRRLNDVETSLKRDIDFGLSAEEIARIAKVKELHLQFAQALDEVAEWLNIGARVLP